MAKLFKVSGEETPLMKQYAEIKSKYPGTIVLFRVGDFYETFGEDAIKTSKILGITLTKRANGQASEVELAGFPYHSLDTYLPRLVKAGERVAICEQLEDPKLAKKVVKRGITEVVTPGLIYTENLLEQSKNNYLCAVYLSEHKKILSGISFLDISTGEFLTTEGEEEQLQKLIETFQPSEIIVPKSQQKKFKERFGENYYLYPLDDWIFHIQNGNELLLKHFQTTSLKGFGIDGLHSGIISAGAILHYLNLNQQHKLGHITKIQKLHDTEYVLMDKFTLQNLELVSSYHPEGRTLFSVLNQTQTAMGARLLRKWILLPLLSIPRIQRRQNAIRYLYEHTELAQQISAFLNSITDIERLTARIAVQRVSPRDLKQLQKSLFQIQAIKKSLENVTDPYLATLHDQLNALPSLQDLLEKTIVDDAPANTKKSGYIKTGFHAELDELKYIAEHGKEYLLNLQQREITRTGIPSLKIGYNNVFGYYIEITHTHKDKVPSDYIRKQTLTTGERYITPELKEYEEKILTAEERISVLEQQIFNDTLMQTLEHIHALQQNASVIAQLDVLVCLANVAHAYNYHLPQLTQDPVLTIVEGRHPVIERYLPIEQAYIPNDVHLNTQDQQILIITGPNMAGKSALLRQVGLITLLAQMGSFVPAKSATIGIVDKIFTRVGASDNISSGESTFMVEMNEAANILNNATAKSLILLDEIGRGTSTYDGISIAWAIVEYLHNNPSVKARTLFATHYHELNELEKQLSAVKNFHVKVQEINGKILFLRKLERGGTEHSFGIHVAEMAGLPKSVTERAKQILCQLESQREQREDTKKVNISPAPQAIQLSLFGFEDEVAVKIKQSLQNLDLNRITPIEALLTLQEWKKWIS
ncbi:MAG: DNA mismatch repair protein MutS [Bacteroidia bacterium]|nr:DNA mismatch repair protein MutS [Bacteroidia bacterium]MDW8302960.1 DNA mismatch repair protein MutS [Bacteroidia bacterium]